MSLYTRKGLAESPGNIAMKLPYAEPQVITRMGQVPRRPQTTGISAIIPLNMTIVDTRTMGTIGPSGTVRTRRVGQTQEP
jgi:hypothetical protein